MNLIIAKVVWLTECWERRVDIAQAIFLGMMLAWTPSLIVLAWLIIRTPLNEDREQGSKHRVN